MRGDAFRIYVLQFATLGFGLVGSIVIARVLGPSNKGVVDLFGLLVQFLTDFGSLGLYAGLLYFLANRGRPLSEVHGTGVAFSVFLGAMLVPAGLAALPLLEGALPGLPPWAIVLGLVLAPTAVYRVIWQNILIGIGRAVVAYQIGLVVAVASLLALGALYLVGAFSSGGVIWTTALAGTAATVWAFVWLRQRAPDLRSNASLLRDGLRFGFPLWIGLVANTVNFKIDQLILNLLLDTRAVGIYAVGVRWAETLFLLDSALIAAALHRISSASPDESFAFTKRVARRQLQISGSAALLLAAAAYPLVLLLYGSAYIEAVLPLLILLPGVISWSVAKVFSQYIVYQRGVRWLPTIFALLGSALNVLLNFLFIPRIGIPGAAMASLVSYGVVLVLSVGLFVRLRPNAS